MEILDFSTKAALLKFLYNLPEDFPIIIKDDKVFFSTPNKKEKEVHKAIDDLLRKYEEWEQSDVSKI